MKSEIRVLLVEDNPGDAGLIEKMLAESTSFRYRVQTVERLSQAHEAIHHRSFDIVLLDLGLPDSQGIDTFERMNQVAQTTAIVVITGLSDDEIALRAVQKGAQDYLVKGEIDARSLTRSLRYAVKRKQIEEELRQSDERFQLANRATFNAIWDWNLQTNAIWYNENFQMLFGYRAEEIEGTIESWTSRIHPEDLDRVTVGIHEAIDLGQQSWSDQYRFRRKDGTYAEIEDRGYIVREESGKPVRMIGAMQDISKRKHTEADLITSKALLSETEKMGSIGGWTFDAETLAQTWTEETFRILEIDLTNSEPKVPEGLDFIAPAYRSMAEQAIQRAIQFGEPYDQEWEIITTKGNKRWVHAVATTHQEHGKTKSVSGSFQDITARKRAMLELAFAQAELKEAHHLAHIGTWDWLIENDTVTWSEELFDIAGRDHSLPAPTYAEHPHHFTPTSWVSLSNAVKWALSTGEPYDLELEMLRPDGSKRWTNAIGGVKRDGKGKVIGLHGMLQDISERKRAEEALRESEEKFRTMAETFPLAIYQTFGIEQILEYSNPAMLKLFGYTREEIPTVAEWWPLAYPDETYRRQIAEEWTAKVRRAIDTKTPIEPMEVEVTCKDGSKKIILWGFITLGDKNFAYGLDLTERKRAEEALRQAKDELEVRVIERTTELRETNIQLQEEKERLAVMLRSIGDGVIATDEHGTVVLLNHVAEELTGWRNDDAFGISLHKVFHIVNELTKVECPDIVDMVISTGGPIGLANHTSLIAKDGQVKSIADSGAPIRDKDGQIIGVIIVFRDITAQRIVEEEVERGHRLESIGLLAGGIAHDFNNILTGILGDISLAKIYAKPSDKVYEKLCDAELTLSHAKGLAHQLLTFSRGGAPIKRATSIGSLLSDSVNFALSGSNVRYAIEIGPDIWSVNVDHIQMVQVFNNILINAREAMPQGGIIRLHGENVAAGRAGAIAILPKDQDFVMISFTDNGKGIPRANLSKVFDAYFTTKSVGGGLGLTIAHSIVKRHDGFIIAESDEGKGAFTILLPAYEEPLIEKLPLQEELSPGHGKVLLMDDQEFILEITGEIVTTLGYQVVTAEDGQKAIDLFKLAKRCGEPFDIIILDLTIPGGMGGKEAMQKIRALDANVKSIVSSGYSNDPVMSEPGKFGFTGVVSKPYTVRELQAEIQRVLHTDAS
jgi:PAS domain S-box-containing protein